MAADEIIISLGLPGYRATPQRLDPTRYDMWVASTASEAVCPRCGQASTAYHDGDERTGRDVPILGHPVYLPMVQRRCTCASCGKPCHESSAVVDWPQRQPRRDPHPLTSQCRGRAIQDVRRKHHIGYRIGERWRYRQAQYQCDTPQRRLPKRVGSEACATRQGHHYATIVVNLRLHQVFDVLDQRRTATVSNVRAARSDRRRLKVAAMDLRRACRNAVQEQCPWAVIVMDRFHGIKSATTAFHTVRKRVARHPAETDRRRLTGRRNLLGKAPEDLSPAKRLELYGVLADFPPLRLAHSLVHGLRRWYNLPDVQMARARLRAWLYRIKKAERNELGELAATMRRWQQWIVNCFRDRVTKGGTEGINTKIKRLKRVAYGLPNFAHIRARILLAFSPEVRSPP